MERSETPEAVAVPESSSSDNQCHASDSHSHKPFTPEVVAVLQSLYKKGMTGWDQRHSGVSCK